MAQTQRKIAQKPRSKPLPKAWKELAKRSAPPAPQVPKESKLIVRLRESEVRQVEEWRRLDAEIKKLDADRKAIKEHLESRLREAGAVVGSFKNKAIVELVPWQRQGYTVEPCSGETLKYASEK